MAIANRIFHKINPEVLVIRKQDKERSNMNHVDYNPCLSCRRNNKRSFLDYCHYQCKK